jgi:hypothetical protein
MSPKLTPQVEMLKQQVGVLKGAPGDQVSRVEAKKKKEPEAEA